MKRSFLILVLAGFILAGYSEILAQTTQPKLNQVELFKQFIGKWQAQWADTVLYFEGKSFARGLEGYYNYKLAGKDQIILEGRQLWGYDSRLDKYVVAQLETGRDIWLMGFWFTSGNEYLMTSLNDVSNPEKAFFKVEGKINSPDSFTEAWIMNGKVVVKYDYNRIR